MTLSSSVSVLWFGRYSADCDAGNRLCCSCLAENKLYVSFIKEKFPWKRPFNQSFLLISNLLLRFLWKCSQHEFRNGNFPTCRESTPGLHRWHVRWRLQNSDDWINLSTHFKWCKPAEHSEAKCSQASTWNTSTAVCSKRGQSIRMFKFFTDWIFPDTLELSRIVSSMLFFVCHSRGNVTNRHSRNILFQFGTSVARYTEESKIKILPGGESNPGLPRDRRGYLPLYYRGIRQEASEIPLRFIFCYLLRLMCYFCYWA